MEPPRDDPDDPAQLLAHLGLAKVERGKEWLVEITLDGGRKGQVRDLRPDLPLVLRY